MSLSSSDSGPTGCSTAASLISCTAPRSGALWTTRNCLPKSTRIRRNESSLPRKDGTRRRLSRRRRQRCAGDARGRHQPSVELAVDVAKEAADFVLLERGLDVIRRGVEEGRKTFANTMKLHPDDDEREPGQHAQHGGCIAFPALSAAAGRPDPAEQLHLRHSGHRHCR